LARTVDVEAKAFIAIIFCAFGFLALTNQWLSWQDGIDQLVANDAKTYHSLAKSFTASSNGIPAGEVVRHHHAQRFFPLFILGKTSDFVGQPIESVFRVFSWILMLATVTVFVFILSYLKLSFRLAIFALFLWLLNPYTFRYYFIVPGMLVDQVFIFGLSLILLGLISVRFWMVVLGLAVAGFGRQTALLLLPGILYWIKFGSGWKAYKSSVVLAMGVLVVNAAGVFLLTRLFAEKVGGSFATHHIFGLFTLIKNSELKLEWFLELCLRVTLPILSVTIIFLTTFSWKTKFKITSENLALILMVLAIISQPILTGPGTGKNAARLGALAVIPAVMLAIWQIKASAHHFSKAGLWLGGGLLIIGSLHHRYTILGPSSVEAYLGLQLLVSVGIFLLFYFSVRNKIPKP
jgi:hypothetical protein